MKIKINRVDMKEISKYKKILDNYKASYGTDSNHGKTENFAVIEINELDELFKLTKELGYDLIISEFDNDITIFDDYL